MYTCTQYSSFHSLIHLFLPVLACKDPTASILIYSKDTKINPEWRKEEEEKKRIKWISLDISMDLLGREPRSGSSCFPLNPSLPIHQYVISSSYRTVSPLPARARPSFSAGNQLRPEPTNIAVLMVTSLFSLPPWNESDRLALHEHILIPTKPMTRLLPEPVPVHRGWRGRSRRRGAVRWQARRGWARRVIIIIIVKAHSHDPGREAADSAATVGEPGKLLSQAEWAHAGRLPMLRVPPALDDVGLPRSVHRISRSSYVCHVVKEVLIPPPHP